MGEQFHLVDVSGDEGYLRGFVEGYFCGRGWEMRGIWFGSDFGLEEEGFLSKLQELLGLKVEKNVLFVSDGFISVFEKAMDLLPDDVRLGIDARRRLLEVRFPFKVRTFNRDLGAEVKALLENRPAGVLLEDTEEEERDETVDHEIARYAPEHGYELELSGTLTGDVGGVLDLYLALVAHDCVTFRHPHMELAPAAK